MIKMQSDRIYPDSAIPESYDAKISTSNDRTEISYNLHKLKRNFEEPDCDDAGFNLDGGNTKCGIYIGIECSNGESMCAFALKLTLHEYTSIATQVGSKATSNPPSYIPDDVDYVDGVIGHRESHYYYLPYSEADGDVVVMLNKTNPIEKGGNMFLAMNVEPNSNRAYTRWSLPTVTKHNIKSQTDNPVSPEIIDIEGAQLKKSCKGNSNCILIFMVYGQSNMESGYRLRVLKGQNKLT